MKALQFIINTLLTLLVVAFMLRVLMPLVRADFRNPFGAAILKLTNPLVLPLRRFVPPGRRLDPASLIALLIVQFVKTALLLILGAGLRIDALLLGGLLDLLITVLKFYFWAILLYALLSWFAGAAYSPMSQVLGRLCEPLLSPVRRVIPPLGGLDLSALFVMIALQALLILVSGA